MTESTTEGEKKGFVIADKYRKLFAEHLELYRTDPERAHIWDATVVGATGPVTTMMLDTVGRRSGEVRQVTIQYFRDGDRYLIVASQGGMPQDPFWYLNLLETPECHIQVGAFGAKARATVAEGAERERLWEKVSNEQENYKRYQARSPRQIPVVILDVIAPDA